METPIVKQVLSGHISPETAYVVEDYPYGFRLRCKKRYWLESVAKKGVRMWEQTTNPKRGDLWNKPKASTYYEFGAAMYLDENNHVQFTGMHRYMDSTEVQKWVDTFRSGVPIDSLEIADRWLAAKIAYDKQRAEGASMPLAATAAYVAFTK